MADVAAPAQTLRYPTGTAAAWREAGGIHGMRETRGWLGPE